MPDITDLTTLDNSAREFRDAIDAELATLNNRMRELREARAKINRYLGMAPGRKAKAKPTNGKAMPGSHVSELTLDAFADYLRTNLNGGELTARDIANRDDFNVRGIGNRSRINLALDKLHDRGTVRLTRIDGHTKVYELT